jgi:hypothetical protein
MSEQISVCVVLRANRLAKYKMYIDLTDVFSEVRNDARNSNALDFYKVSFNRLFEDQKNVVKSNREIRMIEKENQTP